MQGYVNIQILSNVIYHINKLKKKNHMIISIDTQKVFLQTPTLSNRLGVEENFFNFIKNIYKKSTARYLMEIN